MKPKDTSKNYQLRLHYYCYLLFFGGTSGTESKIFFFTSLKINYLLKPVLFIYSVFIVSYG